MPSWRIAAPKFLDEIAVCSDCGADLVADRRVWREPATRG
jgi:hypothetical protein